MSSIEEPGTRGATELSPLNPGTLFHGRYRVQRCLGSGGMGALYEVVHHETERRCVLKTMLGSLLTDADMRARFRLEATVTANIESDHIVDVYDAGIDESTGVPFLVMEYLRGETLANRLRTAGPLPPSEAVRLLLQASLALDRTHAAGIVHRDLKPENLFITGRDDGTPHLKLLDFGIAKIVAQSTNINTTRSFGTPLYMSPEQIRGDGDIDGRADLYALGQIAYTVLVGHAYFEPEVIDHMSVYPLLLKVMQGTAVPASERARVHGVALPARFDSWFAKATHADAAQRFDTAAEQVATLSAVLSSPAAEADLAGSVEGTRVSSRELASTSSRDLVTLAGISKSGGHALREAHRRPPRRYAWPIALLGLAIVASVGLYLQWKRVGPSDTPAAVVVTYQPAAPHSPSTGNPMVGASADVTAPFAREVSVPTSAVSPPSATAMAADSVNSALLAPPSNSAEKALVSRSQREGAPRSSTRRARAATIPATVPYDPSDIR